MRADFVVREVLTGLRRNVTMTIAMVLTTAISLGLVGTGLLAVRTIDRTEQLYSDRVEIQVALTPDVSAADPDCRQPVCSALQPTLENSPLRRRRCASRASRTPTSATSSCSPGRPWPTWLRPQSLPATLRVKLADQAAGRPPSGGDAPARSASARSSTSATSSRSCSTSSAASAT